MNFLEQVTRFLFFTGKGGVGKTSTSCATAVTLADRGHSVLLVSTDPASNLSEVLGTDVGNHPTPVNGTPGLIAMDIDPLAAAEAYRQRVVGEYRGVLPDAAIASIEEQLSGACTTEIAAFDEFAKLLGTEAEVRGYDHVVFDTAYRAHAVDCTAGRLARLVKSPIVTPLVRQRWKEAVNMCRNTRFTIVNSRNARIACLVFVLTLFVCPLPASADWSRDMFETTTHDFGTIAAGAKAEFSFKFQNKYLYDVHVARVRSSCGCSSVRVTRDSLATYETGEIVAHINSDRLRDHQSSTLTVIFDKPRYAEVQLKVSVYIRGDYVLEPSGIDFGEVESGSAPVRELTVTHYGDANWRLMDVQGSNPHVQCELGEPVPSGSRVTYPIKAKLAEDAPPGELFHELFLVSNDPEAKKIPVMVEGRVRPLLSVAPASLYLGSLRPGQSVTKRLVVRAATPFHIVQISADCDCFEFSFTPDEKKTLHLIPVKFTAGEKQAGIRRTLHIRTDLDGAEAAIVALAAIDEQAK